MIFYRDVEWIYEQEEIRVWTEAILLQADTRQRFAQQSFWCAVLDTNTSIGTSSFRIIFIPFGFVQRCEEKKENSEKFR